MLFEAQRQGGLHPQHHHGLVTVADGQVHRFLGFRAELFQHGQCAVEPEPALRGLPEQDGAGAEVETVRARVVRDQPARLQRAHHAVRGPRRQAERGGDAGDGKFAVGVGEQLEHAQRPADRLRTGRGLVVLDAAPGHPTATFRRRTSTAERTGQRSAAST